MDDNKRKQIESSISDVLSSRRMFIPTEAATTQFPPLEEIMDAGRREILDGMMELKPDYEVEVSLGWFGSDGRTFHPGLFSAKQFEEIKKHLDVEVQVGTLKLERSSRKVEIMSEQGGGIRRITNLLNPKDVIFQQKHRFASPRIENPIWGFRISKSSETPLKEVSQFEADTTRTIQRFSYSAERGQSSDFYGFSIDLSIVTEILRDGKPFLKFEVEIERITKLAPEASSRLLGLIKRIIVWSQNLEKEEFVLTLPRREYIVRAHNNLILKHSPKSRYSKEEISTFKYGGYKIESQEVKSKLPLVFPPIHPYQLVKNYWSKPTNVKLFDLTQDSWDATIKIDGTRGFLYFYQDQVWLCGPPHDIRHWATLKTSAFSETLIDGEYLDSPLGEGQIFFGFDILFSNDVEMRFAPLGDRLNTIKTIFKNSGVTGVYLKRFARFEMMSHLPTSTTDLMRRIKEYQLVLEPLEKEIALRKNLAGLYGRFDIILGELVQEPKRKSKQLQEARNILKAKQKELAETAIKKKKKYLGEENIELTEVVKNSAELKAIQESLLDQCDKLEKIYAAEYDLLSVLKNHPAFSEERVERFMKFKNITEENYQLNRSVHKAIETYTLTLKEIVSLQEVADNAIARRSEAEQAKDILAGFLSSKEGREKGIRLQITIAKKILDDKNKALGIAQTTYKNLDKNLKVILGKLAKEDTKEERENLRKVKSDIYAILGDIKTLEAEIKVQTSFIETQHTFQRGDEEEELKKKAKGAKRTIEEANALLESLPGKRENLTNILEKTRFKILNLRRELLTDNDSIITERSVSAEEIKIQLDNLSKVLKEFKEEEKSKEVGHQRVAVTKRHLKELADPVLLAKAIRTLEEEESLSAQQRLELREKIRIAQESKSGGDIIQEAEKLREIEVPLAMKQRFNIYTWIKQTVEVMQKDPFLSTIPVDGIILQSTKNYMAGTRKWKPADNLTIDFLFKLSRDDNFVLMVSEKKISDGGQKPRLTMTPFSGTKKFPLDTVPMVHLDKGLFQGEMAEGRVIECQWNDSIKTFIPLKFRDDRAGIPNAIKPAMDVWNDINNPISQATIFGDTLTVMRMYHNSVKMDLLSGNFVEGDSIVGLGEGQGGDLSKYVKIGLENIIAVEPSEEKVDELFVRYNKLEDRKPQLIVVKNKNPETGDEKYARGEDARDILSAVLSLSPEGENTIAGMTAFFSLTFFAEDQSSWDGLLRTLDDVIPVQAKFIGTVLDGRIVREGLETGQLSPIEAPGFYIKSLGEFSDSHVGNAIEIHIEESKVQNQKEYLFEFEYFSQQLEKIGFVLLSTQFLTSDKMYRNLPMDAKLFSSLFRSFVFIRQSRRGKSYISKEIEIKDEPPRLLKKATKEKGKEKVIKGTELSTKYTKDQLYAYPEKSGKSTCISAILQSLGMSEEDVEFIRNSLVKDLTKEKFASLQKGRILRKYQSLGNFIKAILDPKAYLSAEDVVELLAEKYKVNIIVLNGQGAVPIKNFCSSYPKSIIIYSLDGIRYASVYSSDNKTKWTSSTPFIQSLLEYICSSFD